MSLFRLPPAGEPNSSRRTVSARAVPEYRRKFRHVIHCKDVKTSLDEDNFSRVHKANIRPSVVVLRGIQISCSDTNSMTFLSSLLGELADLKCLLCQGVDVLEMPDDIPIVRRKQKTMRFSLQAESFCSCWADESRDLPSRLDSLCVISAQPLLLLSLEPNPIGQLADGRTTDRPENANPFCDVHRTPSRNMPGFPAVLTFTEDRRLRNVRSSGQILARFLHEQTLSLRLSPYKYCDPPSLGLFLSHEVERSAATHVLVSPPTSNCDGFR